MGSGKKRMPAEWEHQKAILLAFPHEGADWPGKFTPVQWAFIDFIKKIAATEKVLLIVKSSDHQEKVYSMLRRAHAPLSEIEFIIQNTNRSWMRDSGPIIIENETRQAEALQFKFNAWAKYSNYYLDKKVPEAISKYLKIPLKEVKYNNEPVVLEGGAIDVNGKGTLITTRECLLDQQIQVRNKKLLQTDYETIFKEYLGVENVIWLNEGIEGDDTHGHIDDICRFVNPTTVVACFEEDKKDPNAVRLETNYNILKHSPLEDGSSLNVVRLPMPGRIDFEDLRLPASYANFLITNKCVFVPTFNDKNDHKALGIINDLFPERDVIGIHAVDLVWGLGTLHCLSHEIPG